MKLEIRKFHETDVDARARLIYESRQNSPLRNENRTIDSIKNTIERMTENSDDYVQIVALDEQSGELLGLLTIMMDWGEIGVALPWQPIVYPSADQDAIAIALIEHSKKLAETHSKTKLEIWMELQNEQVKSIESTYADWYQKSGFIPGVKEDFMDTDYSKLKDQPYSILNDIEVISMSSISNDEIKDSVFKTFRCSSDEWTNTSTDSQLEGIVLRWLKRNEAFDANASIVFKKDGEIIGFIVLCSEPNYIEIGPIGVVPSQRGRGLGRALILESIKRLSGEEQTIGLSVSKRNANAYRVYSNLGFEKRYEILIYSWIPES